MEPGPQAMQFHIDAIDVSALKRHVPAQSAKGDEIIDAACARMGKERPAFAGLVQGLVN